MLRLFLRSRAQRAIVLKCGLRCAICRRSQSSTRPVYVRRPPTSSRRRAFGARFSGMQTLKDAYSFICRRLFSVREAHLAVFVIDADSLAHADDSSLNIEISFVRRSLAAVADNAEQSALPPSIVCVNKSDLLSKQQMRELQKRMFFLIFYFYNFTHIHFILQLKRTSHSS